MTVSDAIAETYLIAVGKAVAPASTTTKGVKILALLNQFQKQWAKEDWRSMRSTFTLASPVSATATYALSSTIHHISQQEGDYIRIYHTDGVSESDYTLVPIERLYDNGPIRNTGGSNRVAVSGSNLVFTSAFISTDKQYGGSILVPGYSKPTTLVSDTDVIQVDDPQWLTTRAAAAYVFTDITRVQNYDTLLGTANDLWNQMREANDSQHETVTTPWSPLGQTWG